MILKTSCFSVVDVIDINMTTDGMLLAKNFHIYPKLLEKKASK